MQPLGFYTKLQTRKIKNTHSDWATVSKPFTGPITSKQLWSYSYKLFEENKKMEETHLGNRISGYYRLGSWMKDVFCASTNTEVYTAFCNCTKTDHKQVAIAFQRPQMSPACPHGYGTPSFLVSLVLTRDSVYLVALNTARQREQSGVGMKTTDRYPVTVTRDRH